MSPCSRPLGRSRRFGNACGSSVVRGGTIGTYGQFGNADGVIGLFARSCRYLPIVQEPKPYCERYGRRAGYLRNLVMVEYAAAGPRGGALVAVWDGTSPGTSHTIELARRQGLQVFIHRPGVPYPERALEASHT